MTGGARRPSPPEGGEAAGFSLALAEAALTNRASASLDAHGAAPAGEAGAAISGKRAAEQAAPASRANADAPAARRDAPAETTTTRQAGAPQAAAPPPAASPDSPGAVAAIKPESPAAAAIALTAPATAFTARPAAASAAPLENAARIETTRGPRAPLPAPPPAQPQPAAESFARLIARRLDSGASAFEIRLDPPELGRVEARFVIGEDGKAALALKFDNPSAHDLFARDEAALRLALAEAGVDLGGGDLSFTLESRNADTPTAFALAEAPPVAAAPLAASPHSRGLIDLFI